MGGAGRQVKFYPYKKGRQNKFYGGGGVEQLLG